MTYSPFRHVGSVVWKRRPIQLTFFLTARCNSRCPFCFYLGRQEKPAAQSEELTLAEIAKISASLGNLLWLAFSGGEIFLRHDIAEIAALFYKQNKPAIILLPTNGLLPAVIRQKTEEILMKCPRSTIVVKLSLDGPEEIHDAIRGVQGAYRKTMETYEALADLLAGHANFELGINSVFCSANQDHMDDFIDFIAGLQGVKTHTVSLIRGEAAAADLKTVDLQKYQRAIVKLENNLKNKISSTYRFSGGRLKAAQDILQRRLIHKTTVEQRPLLPCYAGRLNLVLTETGDLYPCESFTMKLGSVRQDGYDLQRILKTDHARRILETIKDNCFCSHECYMMTNILFNPRQYPALLREYLQL
jgi:radical SAM protein with 4Fe4S-binding SPASM domain